MAVFTEISRLVLSFSHHAFYICVGKGELSVLVDQFLVSALHIATRLLLALLCWGGLSLLQRRIVCLFLEVHCRDKGTIPPILLLPVLSLLEHK